ncbi:GNAT family N-acetyltransferase [Dietzia sp.]|uniref:GNAT family N-acetyltransferase n=1 Tax=Dietzia sp. TaxID=1871616 RepID=UPI002FD99F0A
MSAIEQPGPDIRRSTLSALGPLEVHALYKLRVDVFVHEQDCPYAEIDEVDPLPSTIHYLAWDGDELAATLRLFPYGAHGGVMHIGRVATAAEFRGRGLAGALLEAAIADSGVAPIEIGAQSYLEHWYGRYGFVRCGDEYLDERIPHIPMRREAAA